MFESLRKNEYCSTEEVAASPSLHLLLNEAKHLGVNSRKLSGLNPPYILYQYQNSQAILQGASTERWQFETDFCRCKHMTMRIAPMFGLSVPKTIVLALWVSNTRKAEAINSGIQNADTWGKSIEEIVQKSIPIIKEKLNYPSSSIIVKPTAEGGGVGVTIDLGGQQTNTKKRKLSDNEDNKYDSDNKLEVAIKKAFQSSELYPYVLVQEQVYGNEFRIYLLQGNIIAVFEKIPSSIEGDGKQSINMLIEKENSNKMAKRKWIYDKKVIRLIGIFTNKLLYIRYDITSRTKTCPSLSWKYWARCSECGSYR